MKYLIYKISCDLGNYVGSTKTKLKERISAHKSSRQSSCKDFFDREYEVTILEEIETDDKIYVLKREQYWIDNTDNTVNRYPTHYEGKQLRLKKAFIYKITGKQGNYIGSTRRNVHTRIIQHKSSKTCGCKELFNDDYEVITLETFNDINDLDLRKREQYWIDNTDNCLNEYKAYQSREDRIQYKKNNDKERYERTKEYILNRNKYRRSWGGDHRFHNNLLQIDLNIFV